MSDSITIVPIGGLDEIGLNCMAIEYKGRILIIDAGLMFPDSSTMPGVDLVIPDFSWIIERADQVEALVLTHGHEDHIGAAGFLMKELPAGLPVFGTRLTLALARDKFREAKVEANYQEIEPRQKLEAGPFKMEFIRVNHSIIEGVAVALETPLGAVIHTGDFKIDQANTEDRIDLFKFAEYGEKGVLALLSDSTNADQPGTTDSENVIGSTLAKIFEEADGRVILACFASSLARIRQVVKAARASGRKLVFEGRSMINIVKLAKSLGYLQLNEDDEIASADSGDYPSNRIVIVATGSQGEPMSALARMAHGEHKQVIIREGDTIILSSRSIPGNEKDINHLIDMFYRQGAKVVEGRRSLVHSSGHGRAEELKLMLSLTRPRFLVPIHGAPGKRVRHKELALSLGWREEEVLVIENGQPVCFDQSGARLEEPVESGRKLVDGNRLGEPEDPVLRNRLRLAGGGLVVVTVVLSPDGRRLMSPPMVNISGVHYESDFDLSLEAAAVAEKTVGDWQNGWIKKSGGSEAGQTAEGHLPAPLPLWNQCSSKRLAEEELAEKLRLAVRALFRQSISRKPTIWPQVIFVEGE